MLAFWLDTKYLIYNKVSTLLKLKIAYVGRLKISEE